MNRPRFRTLSTVYARTKWRNQSSMERPSKVLMSWSSTMRTRTNAPGDLPPMLPRITEGRTLPKKRRGCHERCPACSDPTPDPAVQCSSLDCTLMAEVYDSEAIASTRVRNATLGMVVAVIASFGYSALVLVGMIGIRVQLLAGAAYFVLITLWFVLPMGALLGMYLPQSMAALNRQMAMTKGFRWGAAFGIVC